MKYAIALFVLLATSLCAEDASQAAYNASEATLAAGVATNIAMSFRPYQKTTVQTFTEICPNLPAGFCSTVTIPSTVTIHPEPVGRTVGLSLGTVGVIVAEHFIVKKFPRSKKWFAIVNFGGGGVAGVTAGLH
jgi:hypothetical protein